MRSVFWVYLAAVYTKATVLVEKSIRIPISNCITSDSAENSFQHSSFQTELDNQSTKMTSVADQKEKLTKCPYIQNHIPVIEMPRSQQNIPHASSTQRFKNNPLSRSVTKHRVSVLSKIFSKLVEWASFISSKTSYLTSLKRSNEKTTPSVGTNSYPAQSPYSDARETNRTLLSKNYPKRSINNTNLLKSRSIFQPARNYTKESNIMKIPYKFPQVRKGTTDINSNKKPFHLTQLDMNKVSKKEVNVWRAKLKSVMNTQISEWKKRYTKIRSDKKNIFMQDSNTKLAKKRVARDLSAHESAEIGRKRLAQSLHADVSKPLQYDGQSRNVFPRPNITQLVMDYPHNEVDIRTLIKFEPLVPDYELKGSNKPQPLENEEFDWYQTGDALPTHGNHQSIKFAGENKESPNTKGYTDHYHYTKRLQNISIAHIKTPYSGPGTLHTGLHNKNPFDYSEETVLKKGTTHSKFVDPETAVSISDQNSKVLNFTNDFLKDEASDASKWGIASKQDHKVHEKMSEKSNEKVNHFDSKTLPKFIASSMNDNKFTRETNINENAKMSSTTRNVLEKANYSANATKKIMVLAAKRIPENKKSMNSKNSTDKWEILQQASLLDSLSIDLSTRQGKIETTKEARGSEPHMQRSVASLPEITGMTPNFISSKRETVHLNLEMNSTANAVRTGTAVKNDLTWDMLHTNSASSSNDHSYQSTSSEEILWPEDRGDYITDKRDYANTERFVWPSKDNLPADTSVASNTQDIIWFEQRTTATPTDNKEPKEAMMWPVMDVNPTASKDNVETSEDVLWPERKIDQEKENEDETVATLTTLEHMKAFNRQGLKVTNDYRILKQMLTEKREMPELNGIVWQERGAISMDKDKMLKKIPTTYEKQWSKWPIKTTKHSTIVETEGLIWPQGGMLSFEPKIDRKTKNKNTWPLWEKYTTNDPNSEMALEYLWPNWKKMSTVKPRNFKPVTLYGQIWPKWRILTTADKKDLVRERNFWSGRGQFNSIETTNRQMPTRRGRFWPKWNFRMKNPQAPRNSLLPNWETFVSKTKNQPDENIWPNWKINIPNHKYEKTEDSWPDFWSMPSTFNTNTIKSLRNTINWPKWRRPVEYVPSETVSQGFISSQESNGKMDYSPAAKTTTNNMFWPLWLLDATEEQPAPHWKNLSTTSFERTETVKIAGSGTEVPSYSVPTDSPFKTDSTKSWIKWGPGNPRMLHTTSLTTPQTSKYEDIIWPQWALFSLEKHPGKKRKEKKKDLWPKWAITPAKERGVKYFTLVNTYKFHYQPTVRGPSTEFPLVNPSPLDTKPFPEFIPEQFVTPKRPITETSTVEATKEPQLITKTIVPAHTHGPTNFISPASTTPPLRTSKSTSFPSEEKETTKPLVVLFTENIHIQFSDFPILENIHTPKTELEGGYQITQNHDPIMQPLDSDFNKLPANSGPEAQADYGIIPTIPSVGESWPSLPKSHGVLKRPDSNPEEEEVSGIDSRVDQKGGQYGGYEAEEYDIEPRAAGTERNVAVEEHMKKHHYKLPPDYCLQLSDYSEGLKASKSVLILMVLLQFCASRRALLCQYCTLM